MTLDLTTLDAHEQPSEELRAIWKGFSRAEKSDILKSNTIDDFTIPEKEAEFLVAGTIPASSINRAFERLDEAVQVDEDVKIYHHPLLPGLLIVPSLLPPAVQKTLVSRLVHRDLSNPTHQTNLHLHYDLPYPQDEEGKPASFFTLPPDAPTTFQPKDPSVHRPLSMKQVMERRLHWVTLGGQYDWTNRVYPGEAPPAFPLDITGFLEDLFPETLAQAAIVNFYTPGDTMMMHRDVSEETDKGLVSISLGCDGLFMIAPNEISRVADIEERHKTEKQYLILRLRSGDAIYMTKESRYAWHGVPKVLKGTCPDYLEDWPAEDGKYEDWKGWMRNKRINLNVRQMRD